MKKKLSIYKCFYELNSQLSIFGCNNLFFKTINIFKKQQFDNFCINFRLNKLTKKINLFLSIIIVD